MINRKLISKILMYPVVAIALQVILSNIAYTQEVREYYNGIRALGMGGAQIAVVNDETALLVNPAALGRLRSNYGTIFDPEIETTWELISFVDGNDLLSPFDIEKAATAADKKRGNYLHNKLQVFPSFVAKNFGIGLHHQYILDAEMNTDGTELSTYYRNDMSVVMGFNFRFFDGRIKLGANARFISRIELNEVLDATQAITMDPHAKEGAAIATDVGLIMTAPWVLLPTISAVARDVGGTKFTAGSGLRRDTLERPDEIKQDIDVGISVFPIHGKDSRSVFSIESRSLLKAAEDEDKSKYLHIGYEYNFADFLFFRAGMHQRYWTAGAELASEHTQIQIASYGEEIGVAGQPRENRRYVLKFVFRF